MLLSVDTSSRYGGVALSGDDGQVVETRMWRSAANHTAQLMPAVTELLSARGIRAAELTGVAAALGPGPFSALRVGVSAAKGLAMAGGFPIVGVDTLLLEAQRYLEHAAFGQPQGENHVVAWLEAGRNEVAAGVFGASGERLREDRVAAPGDLLHQDAGRPLTTVYCGEAAWARRSEIAVQAGNRSGLIMMPWTPADRLWALAEVAARRLSEGQSDELATTCGCQPSVRHAGGT